MTTPIIYCFLNGGSPEWWAVLAVAEDGTTLAGHVCSSPSFFRHDIGITSDRKHDKYDAHYPNGWTLEWVDYEDTGTHKGLQRAFKLADEAKEKVDA